MTDMAINKDFLMGYGAGKASGGGGGNPNQVIVLEETLKNPFDGYVATMDLGAAVVNGVIDVDASIMGFEDPIRLIVDNAGSERIFAYNIGFIEEIPNGIVIEWHIDYTHWPEHAEVKLLYAYYYDNGVAQDFSDSLELFPAVCTLYIHPMPQS